MSVGILLLDEFVLIPRGPCLFDSYEHPTPVPSPVGDFIVCLDVKMDQSPSSEMLQAAARLIERFEQDRELVAQMIFDEYMAVRDDPEGRWWPEECGVPADLKRSELHNFLSPRQLSVADDCSAAVYVGPDWDREHGLTYELTPEGWEKLN